MAIRKPTQQSVARTLSAEEYAEGILNGNRVRLSQAITLIESTIVDHRRLAEEIIERCIPHAGRSIRLGITGIPGVGKSTFIEALGLYVIKRHRRKLAVLAVDPSSSRTHGSILGDKVRMSELARQDNAYIRPSPSAGSLGGVARKTRESILLCEAAGFDTIFVETVGVGQSETAVHSMVDCFLLLMIAGAGDELQGIKRGIMEMADIIAINKADGENQERARRAANEYSQALHLYPTPDSGWQPEVLTCSALNSTDIDSVWDRVLAHYEHMRARNLFSAHRREQARHWLRQSLQDDLWQDFLHHPEIATRYPELEQRVLRGEMHSFAAARQLLEAYTGKRPPAR